MKRIASFASIYSYVTFAKADAAGGAPADPPKSETVPAVVKPSVPVAHVGRTVTFATGQFKVAKQVTRQVLKQSDGETIFVQITAKIYQGETLKGAKRKPDGTPEMAPARLAEVIDLRSGNLALIIVNNVLEGALNDRYPKDTYINVPLAVEMLPKQGDKRYKTFNVWELERTGDAPEATGEVAE